MFEKKVSKHSSVYYMNSGNRFAGRLSGVGYLGEKVK